MIIERFSKTVIASGILRFYVATGFFGISLFFLFNVSLFTPMEIVLGIIFATIFFKTLSNVMLSLLILLFNLDNKKAELDFKYHTQKIDELLSELTTTDSNSKNTSTTS
ncbi:hypothetical protein [Arcobacter sp. F2176]|uniref:hypothetical protein n=1 Tax=unclassified Arcobacter TaxID=2593671 RepID=UPI00100AFF51|nr:hypothetical protein [Arcobacter sp. F2176]RXJ80056.1 hypothetical protein CRU95_12145 [Arcobacter sp. F2176]